MNREISDIRNEYSLRGIVETDLQDNPILQFKIWFAEVLKDEIYEANAMILSTVSDGRPKSRVVLLKDIDDLGFTFFTNYNSRKGKEMEANPQVAITFFWKELERQVRIEGRVQKVTVQESDEYFNSRPRGSQLGAWVSNQSEVIESREFLDEKLAYFESAFAGKPVPRPEHWGGYRVIPEHFEFWQGRPSRLHDRFAYTQEPDGSWLRGRLSP